MSIMSNQSRYIAYFTMEIAIEAEMRTYSGGLGVLAGDTARSAADLGIPFVVVSLLYRKGYFRQSLDQDGVQHEHLAEWKIEEFLEETPAKTIIELEGREIFIRAYKYELKGHHGFVVPLYFLDTDLEENDERARGITQQLYAGDSAYRLCQEAVLGIGGVRVLRELGYHNIERFHMNEGHASLLTIELLDERLKGEQRSTITSADVDALREQCVFTTHTPVEAGHDRFSQGQLEAILGKHDAFKTQHGFCADGVCNMTHLGFNMSDFVNGVAKKHGQVSREMFDGYSIDSITNGIHVATFACPPIRDLFDKYIPNWRDDNFSLRYAMGIPHHELWEAHLNAKQQLLAFVKNRTGVELDQSLLTIGFARRATPYKRADLIFSDMERLKEIVSNGGKFQLIYAGKAHPKDEEGKNIIRRVVAAKKELQDYIPIVYLENYDLEIGKLITSGVDIWLNTPQPPLEASGTSGMKAAINGVPSFSVLDGWWIEGWIEGITGWAISADPSARIPGHGTAFEAASFYNKLDQVIAPMFYRDRVRFQDVMRHCIALNGSFFNTERMMKEYVYKAYYGPSHPYNSSDS